jgi:hypothetical protein
MNRKFEAKIETEEAKRACCMKSISRLHILYKCTFKLETSSQFLSPWLAYIVDYARVHYTPQSGTKNLALGCTWEKTVEHRPEVFSERQKSCFQKQNCRFFWKKSFPREDRGTMSGVSGRFFKNIYGARESIPPSYVAWASICRPEPVLLNVYGAQELIPRNEFRQPM